MKYKKLMLSLFLVLCIISIFADEMVPGELIVKLHGNANSKALNDFILSYARYRLQKIHYISVRNNIVFFKYDTKIVKPNVIILQMEQDNNVISVSHNYIFELTEYIPDDYYFKRQYALKNTGTNLDYPLTPCLSGADIKATFAWDVISKLPQENHEREITVAVLDNSFYMEHPDINWKAEFAFNASDSTSVIPFYTPHGTKTSSIIASKINNEIGTAGIGYNDKVKALPIHVGSGASPVYVSYGAIASGLEYVWALRHLYNVSNGTQGVFIVAVNCSFSSGNYSEIRTAIEDLEDLGVLVVAAAGNNGQNNDIYPFYPASYNIDTVISVTATSNRDERWYEIFTGGIFYGNYGLQSVDLSAPAYEVRCADWDPVTERLYGTGGATSIAAPHVAGAVGLLYQTISSSMLNSYNNNNPSHNRRDLALLLKSYILDGVDPIPALQGMTVTGGRLNTYIPVLLTLGATRISTDTVISHPTSLNKYYIIESGASLTFANYPENYNQIDDLYIVLRNSDLIFSNCHLDIEEIQTFGEYCQISVNNSVLYMECNQFILDRKKIELHTKTDLVLTYSEINMAYSFLSIDNHSEIVADNAGINISHGNLILNGGSLVELNNSTLTLSDDSKIIGHTPEYIEGYYTWGDNFITTSHEHGDRIYINNSRLEMNGGSISKGGVDKWEGLYFSNCNTPTTLSYISADICGIETIDLNTSNVSFYSSVIDNIGTIMVNTSAVSFQDSEIKNIFSLRADNDSYLELVNTSYHHNTEGIVTFNTQVEVDGSSIYSNISNGGLSINNFANELSFVKDSFIYDNPGYGLDIRNAMVDVFQCQIYENLRYGYYKSSATIGKIIGNTKIKNNVFKELYAHSLGFPTFLPYNSVMPTVADSIYVAPYSPHLLSVEAHFTGLIHVHNINIDSSDPARFYPHRDRFCFGCGRIKQAKDILFESAISYLYEKEYAIAMNDLKEVIETYPDSDEAKMSVTILPYLQSRIDGDFPSLISYLELIDSSNLDDLKQETKALSTMFYKDYLNAVNLYEEIIQDPPSEIDGLLAELDQAYCYLKLVETETRAVLPKSTRNPKTINEYLQVKDDIDNRIFELLKGEQLSSTLTITPFVTSNYPNPFNPSTTISFTLPKDGPVTIDVYNIKGQKVRSLVSDSFQAGQHSVVWAGDNDYHYSVGSGIYFYRMAAGDYVAVRKMLLLK